MKKSVALFLLTVFTFNLVGLNFLFGFQLFQVRNQKYSCIIDDAEHKKMVEIGIPLEAKNLINLGSERVMYFRGELYDVVQKEPLSDGSLVLHCYKDVEEKAYLKAFSQLIKSARKKQNKKNPGIKIFKYLSRTASEETISELAFYPHCTGNFFGYLKNYSAPIPDTKGPPPRKA